MKRLQLKSNPQRTWLLTICIFGDVTSSTSAPLIRSKRRAHFSSKQSPRTRSSPWDMQLLRSRTFCWGKLVELLQPKRRGKPGRKFHWLCQSTINWPPDTFLAQFYLPSSNGTGQRLKRIIVKHSNSTLTTLADIIGTLAGWANSDEWKMHFARWRPRKNWIHCRLRFE